MRGDGQEEWWHESSWLAGTTVATAVVLAVLPILISRLFGATLLFGLPVPLFLLALAAPLGGLGAIFWFARQQDDLDHRYDVAD